MRQDSARHGRAGQRMFGGLGLAALCVTAACSAAPEAPAPPADWRHYSGDAGSRKYAPLDLINRDTVANLQIAWRRPAVAPELAAMAPGLAVGPNFRATPLMVDGVLYAPNGVGLVEAFDAGTGATIWVQSPPGGPETVPGAATRGVAYWDDGSDESARILTQRDGLLIALEATTGEPVDGFGEGGTVDVSAGRADATPYTWSGAPHVCRDVVILGSSMSDSPMRREAPPGDVWAYDVRTGALRWTFHVVPRAGEPGVESWEGESWRYTGHANLWTLMSSDEELGYAYLPLSSATSDMYGGHRPGDNLYSDSLVAIDCQTGERIWHYQIVHHDLWDYDLPAAPILADITVEGRPIRAVVQLTKQSWAFVFDRVTGEPVWPIEERAVPAGDVPGEWYAPTQPFPSRPPAFDRQHVTDDDLIDFTPELREAARQIVGHYVHGPLYTPPSVKGGGADDTRGTIELPGSTGGADWQGGAFDPETGILYVPSITGPFVADLVPGAPEETDLRFVHGTREFPPAPMGLPLLKPPYGRITAIDLNTGSILWTVPNGEGPRQHPLLADLDLPPLGHPGRAAPLLTRALLFVGEGDPVMASAARTPPGMPLAISPGAGGRAFRAYDKVTGAVVWAMDLPSGVTGAPMTYLHQGRQYIVVATGSTDGPIEFVALSLP